MCVGVCVCVCVCVRVCGCRLCLCSLCINGCTHVYLEYCHQLLVKRRRNCLKSNSPMPVRGCRRPNSHNKVSIQHALITAMIPHTILRQLPRWGDKHTNISFIQASLKFVRVLLSDWKRLTRPDPVAKRSGVTNTSLWTCVSGCV